MLPVLYAGVEGEEVTPCAARNAELQEHLRLVLLGDNPGRLPVHEGCRRGAFALDQPVRGHEAVWRSPEVGYRLVEREAAGGYQVAGYFLVPLLRGGFLLDAPLHGIVDEVLRGVSRHPLGHQRDL